jgi:hypothetical protein
MGDIGQVQGRYDVLNTADVLAIEEFSVEVSETPDRQPDAGAAQPSEASEVSR